jgi:hypothetical protein
VNRLTRLALAPVAAALFLAAAAEASTPASGTLASKSTPAVWSGTSPTGQSVPGQAGCLTPTDPTCDHFALNVTLREGSNFVVGIAGRGPADDWDLYVFYPDGSLAKSSATGSGSESVVLEHTNLHGSGPYTVSVMPFSVSQPYDGVAQSTRNGTFDTGDTVACLEGAPVTAAPYIPGISRQISLDTVVLLDGVTKAFGQALMTKARESYAPLGIDLKVVKWKSVSFTGDLGSEIILQAKDLFGGGRPAGSDVVLTLTSKDIASIDATSGEKDYGLVGLADCIGGVRFAGNAFAVSESAGIEPLVVGPFTLEVNAHAEAAAHEIGHLMGVHHHYGNCVEGNLEGDTYDLSPCTLMFPFVDFTSLNFGTFEGAVVRGHAEAYATP